LPETARRQALSGAAFAAAAYGSWGFNPIYFKAVSQVPALEILCHRVVWSVLLIAGLVTLMRRWPEVRAALVTRRVMLTLVVTTLIIGGNWLLFIWATNAGHLLQVSLGYYMNPLLNVLLGVVALKERLTRTQLVAVGLAVVGVLNMAIQVGAVPWVSLALAGSFALYGLLRKTVAVASVEGLFIEVLLLTPFATVWLIWLDAQGVGQFARESRALDLLLIFAGPMTTFPLIWFASAARRLRLAILGFFQYIAPTLHFGLAVFAYGEAFTTVHLVTFAFIWTAVVVVSLDSLGRLRARPDPA
jgi:chloramphenicol-sensitive protein RarD